MGTVFCNPEEDLLAAAPQLHEHAGEVWGLTNVLGRLFANGDLDDLAADLRKLSAIKAENTANITK